MKVSLITVCFNRASTITETISSVKGQTMKPEHIIIDGDSRDNTLNVIKDSGGVDILVSEPDKGLYHALNKATKLAGGNVIGFLHSDDVFASDQVIELVTRRLHETGADAIYGDLNYVSEDLTSIKRKWRSGKPGSFKTGWMPPHPTLYVKKEVFEKVGPFRLDLGSAADYEWMLRAIEVNKIKLTYLPMVMVNMRVGGLSNESVAARKGAFHSDLRAWEVNDLGKNYLAIVLKKFRKLPQFF